MAHSYMANSIDHVSLFGIAMEQTTSTWDTFCWHNDGKVLRFSFWLHVLLCCEIWHWLLINEKGTQYGVCHSFVGTDVSRTLVASKSVFHIKQSVYNRIYYGKFDESSKFHRKSSFISNRSNLICQNEMTCSDLVRQKITCSIEFKELFQIFKDAHFLYYQKRSSKALDSEKQKQFHH